MSITEDELKERAVAPRVTFEEVLGSIRSEEYHRLTSTLTVCVLTLMNGFTVTGQSACADPANYQADIGEKISKQDAINKIWPLLGYELRTKLALIDGATEPSFPNMGTFVGTKVIHAFKMDKMEYCHLRGWQVPADENPLDDGYLVEYTDGGKPNVVGFNGYVSWSPKGVFETAYRGMARSAPVQISVPANQELIWLDRVKVELIELEDRVIKLIGFLASPAVTKLEPIEWSALREQRKGMEVYLSALRGRVARASI